MGDTDHIQARGESSAQRASQRAVVPWYRLRLWQIQAVRDCLLVLAVFALISLGAKLSVVTVPLLVGLGLAYLVEPLIGWGSKRLSWATRPRIIAALVATILIGGTVVSLLTVPRMIGQANELVRNRALYAERFEELLEQDWVPESVRENLGPGLRWFAAGIAEVEYDDFSEPIEPANNGEAGAEDLQDNGDHVHSEETDSAAEGSLRLNDDAEQLRALIRQQVREEMREEMLLAGLAAPAAPGEAQDGRAGANVGSQVQRLMATLLAVFGGIISAFMFIFLTLFFFVFISLAYPRVIDSVWSLTPVAKRDRLHHLASRMDIAVSGFIRGRLLICGFMAVAYGIGWSVFGVPHALLLAAVTGILGLIPFAAMFMLPVAIVLLAVSVGTGSESFWYRGDEGAIRWWAVLLLPSLVFVVVQVMDDYVLTPFIQGKATNLDVVSIVVAVIAGGSLAGVYGMLLAIPVAACLRILWIEVALPHIRAWSEGRRTDPLPVEDQPQ
ncbi:MAG: AI-2E family transporter [Planctomycetota bacterium]|nr:MAG: AI-2E family transporter [Planctomycetota bacterium]